MRSHHRDHGQAMVVFALALFLVIVPMLGLAIDGSFAWVKQRQTQNGADFGALAGTAIILQNAQGAACNGAACMSSDVKTAISTKAAANYGAAVTGFGTAAGPQYTDWNGNPIGSIPSTSSAIPSAAYGVEVAGATTTWHTFFLGLIGINSWTAGAGATARFTGGTSGLPGSLYVLGNLTPKSTLNIVAAGSVLVGGSLAPTSTVTITSNNGSVVIDTDLIGTSSTNVSAPNGTVDVGRDLSATSGTTVSAGYGWAYVGRDVTFTSGGTLSATGSVLVGRNLKLTSAGTNPIHASAIEYAQTYTLTSSSQNPSPVHVSSLIVPAAPTVSDPFASLPDATTATVQQEGYPSYNGGSPPSGLTPMPPVSLQYSQTSTVTPTPNQIWSVSVTNNSGAGAVLNPGIYSSLSATNCTSSPTAFTLNPGTYYFNGSSSALSLLNGCQLVSTGTGGVTLVFLNQSGSAVTNGSSMQIQAPAATLTPSATYPWPGVAIFFARGNTSSLDLTTGTQAIVGNIYAPSATLYTVSTAGATVQGVVVVKNYTPTSTSVLKVTGSTGGTSFPFGPIQLVK